MAVAQRKMNRLSTSYLADMDMWTPDKVTVAQTRYSGSLRTTSSRKVMMTVHLNVQGLSTLSISIPTARPLLYAYLIESFEHPFHLTPPTLPRVEIRHSLTYFDFLHLR